MAPLPFLAVEPVQDDATAPTETAIPTPPLVVIDPAARPGLHVRLFGTHQFFRL